MTVQTITQGYRCGEWSAPTRERQPDGEYRTITVADIIDYERTELGNIESVTPQVDMAILRLIPAKRAMWVTIKRTDVMHYRRFGAVEKLTFDPPAVVAATDSDGGVLIFF